ncbi:MMPL family transporter [Streptomyces sp. NRRL F-525]|uniref:MMPL family transporter n=1 Tax=Streptomyces sp. NRRL F-525 TaxID=1463861 RepID=UPI000AF79B5C|nr:MMPL family transporter [Streptomyces sp. NRRL F-525]
MERILDSLGRAIAAHPWRAIAAWILAAVVLFGISSFSGGAFGNEYTIPGADSQHAVDLATEHFPATGATTTTVVWHTATGSLKDPDKAAVIASTVQAFGREPKVDSAASPLAAGARISTDGRTATSDVQYGAALNDLSASDAKLLDSAAAGARSAGVLVDFRGQVPDLASTAETGPAEFIGIIAALIVLLVAFGSVVAAGLPVITALIGLGVGIALSLTAASVMAIPTIAPSVAVMLGLGAGVDYALFVVTRFRQLLDTGLSKQEAVGKTLASAGHAVFFAGGTVVAAILGLLLVGVPFIGGTGMAAALTVLATMLAALTLLPAVLALLGHRVNRWRVGRRPAVTQATADGAPITGRWASWGARIGRRPTLFALAATAIMLAIAAPALSMRLGTPDDGNQPTSFTQRRAYDQVAADFGPGWNAPLLLTVALPPTGGADALDRLTSGLTADLEVAAVTPAEQSQDGKYALVTVVPKHSPQAVQVSRLVHRIRDDIGPAALKSGGGRAYVGGTTAFAIDMADTVGARLPLLLGAVLVAGALLLFAMFRAPWIAVKSVVMAVLSIGAAYGVLVAVFQWGWGRSLLGVQESLPIQPMVPMLLFAVLFGLSMDYEVFLLSATRDEYLAGGDARRAVVAGLSRTGRVIAAAAAIMTLVFLSFAGISDPILKMFGLGLAVAVVLDATIIRLVLGPAVLTLLGERAWWPARPRTPHPGATAAYGTADAGPAGDLTSR